ncbi:MAG: murein biosynthesis integral membrane protein MurJ [Candidatus Omnitrophota bacterium]|nr:murein biosynthesis integral membrane protein MurJ [Candidatus Omnitrophota bacterium]
MSKKHIIKSAGTIGFATVISRVLGFVRDIIIARYFGTARYAEAFVVAFRIPNMLRDLVGEGATNAAFVPVLSEYAVKKKEEFWELANVILNLLLVTLSAITVAGIFASPWIVRFMAPGFLDDPEKFAITVKLTRLMFPYILLIGLTAYTMGVLNSLKHFSAPAFGPCLLNIAIIICAIIWGESVMGLVSGVLIGGILQLAVQIPVLYKKGFKFSFAIKLNHPAANKIGTLMLPRVIGSCMYQLNLFINTILASLSGVVGSGGVAALYYANRIFQFPLAIFGIAIAQAALPTMSREALEKEPDKLKLTLSFSLRVINFIIIPASIGLIVLAVPITKTLFERGKFDQYSTLITANALVFYSIGLFSYSGIKILVSCFYSLQDTLTPVKIAGASLLLNIALNLALMFPLKIGGLALAASISGIFNFLALFFILRNKIGPLDGRRILNSFLKVLLASLAMAAVIYICAFKINLNLFIVILIAMLSYVGATFIFDVKEAKEFLSWASTRK